MSFGLNFASLANSPLRLMFGIDGDAYDAALQSLDAHWDNPKLLRPFIMTLVDFTVPAKSPRLWMFNLALQIPLFYTPVAHGTNSGGAGAPATKFSNKAGTHKSCIGAFATNEKTHNSSLGHVKGHGLKVYGLDAGMNDNARARGIVFHGADYVKTTGAGRSHGCFATIPSINETLLPMIAGGTFVYAWGGASPTVD
ncbi:MAG: murein L,D-transpeptidase catalytic domain family protein [Planctomycetota bacterium]|nr:murein L,D-transpeptidase catalytic domain family protein [Planctomycetaceae bacterium]MDQ3329428.1 murein L,D-transpeptidase catalytic domain family protein [Planctomycetota bacterium]